MSTKHRSSSKSKDKDSSSKKDKGKEKKKDKKEKKEKEEKKEKKERKKEKKPKSPEPEPEEQYEEDFEDYDDDFEAEEEEKKPRISEKIEEVEKKLEESDEEEFHSHLVERLTTSYMRRSIPPPPPTAQSKSVDKWVTQVASASSAIDNKPYYNASNEEERKSQEQRAYERLSKLRGLISIETTKCTVFTDISSNIFEPPNALPSNLSHAFTQTGKDMTSEEIQTETAETEEKETQMPHLESRRVEERAEKQTTPEDRARFKKFFYAATQTIREILISSEKSAEEDETQEKSTSKFSRGYNPFKLCAVVTKSKATCIQKGEADSVLVAFEILESPAEDLINKSLIVEFYVHKRRPPKRLFVVESTVSAMYLSQSTFTLYVCLADGTFCAFDLSATDASFKSFLPWVDSETDIALRRPTFDSSFLSMTISDATPLFGITVTKSSVGEDISTIDTSGTISYWVASRVEKNELKVLLTAVIRPHPVLKRHSASFAVSAFCHVTKPLRFFVGTDTGMLYSMYKSDTSQAMPKVYNTEKEKYGEVSVISANPSDQSILLVGYSNGSLSIYRTTQSSALINIPTASLSTRVTWLTWSFTNPSAFYAVHNGNVITYWDLGYQVSPRSVDHRMDSLSILSSCTWQSDSANIGYLAFGMDSGDAEVHVLENPARKNPNESILEIVKRLKNL